MKDTISPARTVLLMSLGLLDSETQTRINSGEIKFTEQDHLIKATISGGGRQYLLDENTDLVKGKITIDKGRLPKGVNFVFDRISLGLSSGAVAEENPLNVNFTNKVVTATMSKALLNSTLRIIQDDAIKFEKPIEALLAEELADRPRGAKDQAYNVDYPILLEEQKQIKVEIEVPTGQTITADNTSHIQLYLCGVSTKRR